MQISEHLAGHVTQPTSHPVPFDRRADRLGDDQPDLRRRRRGNSGGTGSPVTDHTAVHDDVGLYRPSAPFDRRTEIRRPLHPELSREHRGAACAQAVRERRPLRRRPVTMARPARVRIRSRNPCTRARRRLLGWKVRLPLATAHSPCCVLRRVRGRHTGSPLCLPHATHSVSSVNFCVLLVTGAVSGLGPVAAVSPTFGRLFEGTDAGSPGQTTAPGPLTQRRRRPQARPTIHTGHTRHGRSGGARFCRDSSPRKE